MSKHKQTLSSVPLTCSAVAVTRDGSFLSEAVEIVIKDGVVVDVKVLTRGPDVIAQSVGKATQALWNHYRETNSFQAQPYRKEAE
jgi:hypothetical protein